MSLRSIIRLLFAGGLLVCLTGVALAAKHTVLVVMTHRDDHLSIAPLLAKYAAEGHTVHFAMFTGLQDPTAEPGPGREELMCASRVLGVKETFVMRAPVALLSASMKETNTLAKAFAERMIEIIDQTRPDVIVTWGPDGLTGHPGHILVSNLITRIFQQQALLKHKPRKLYYVAYPETRLPDKRLPFGVLASGSDKGEALAGPFGTMSDIFITTRIDGRPHLKQVREAIACFTMAKREANKEWQREWYERLATTLGGTVSLRLVMPASGKRETSIFKGL